MIKKDIVINNLSSGSNEEKSEKLSNKLRDKNEKNSTGKGHQKKMKNTFSFHYLSTIKGNENEGKDNDQIHHNKNDLKNPANIKDVHHIFKYKKSQKNNFNTVVNIENYNIDSNRMNLKDNQFEINPSKDNADRPNDNCKINLKDNQLGINPLKKNEDLSNDNYSVNLKDNQMGINIFKENEDRSNSIIINDINEIKLDNKRENYGIIGNKKPTYNPYLKGIKSKKNITINNEVKNEVINEETIRQQIEKEMKEKKEMKKFNKENYVPYEHKEYNENEIDDLEFEEAVIYDKRKLIDIFWFALKQKQLIINTFFTHEPFKPFSIKLSILLFSYSCYFVINGLLYNEEYISSQLEKESNTFIDFLNDSIERIIFTSIVGGLITFIIGIVFNTEKKIESTINKRKNNLILLKGEISVINKRFNIIISIFIVFQFLVMTCFVIYIFCFCYVYHNSIFEWIKSSFIIFAIIQSFSVLTIFIIASFRYLSIKYQLKLCFNINMYLYQQY